MGKLEATDAPAGIKDMATDLPPIPADWELDAFPEDAAEQVNKLFFTRTIADPITNNTYQANEMRDFFRFGWEPTNLQVPIGKKKAIGESGWELDAFVLCPVICPDSFWTASDNAERHPCNNLFIETKSNTNEKEKLPKHLRDWHKDDIALLRRKLADAKPWLERRAPPGVDAEWNVYRGNRHPREVQRAFHLAALTWQLQQGFEKAKGIVAKELDAWTMMVVIDMMTADPANGIPPDYKLLQFLANRLEDTVNLNNFNEVGFQNFFSRYVFVCFYLGEDDFAWDAACQISKLRGGEFTKSPMYDAIIEMRDDPAKFADLYESNPRECLNYFRI